METCEKLTHVRCDIMFDKRVVMMRRNVCQREFWSWCYTSRDVAMIESTELHDTDFGTCTEGLYEWLLSNLAEHDAMNAWCDERREAWIEAHNLECLARGD